MQVHSPNGHRRRRVFVGHALGGVERRAAVFV
jgi:hypothetical protein